MELIVGCCGAVRLDVISFCKKEPIGDKAFKVAKGLQGGHSGIDIHLQRANANKLLFHFLKTLVLISETRLAFVEGWGCRKCYSRENLLPL